MSGGHFQYNGIHLEDILEDVRERIQDDIDYNDVTEPAPKNEWECDNGGGHVGFQWNDETIEVLKRLVGHMEIIEMAFRQYDLLVSGDTSEETFLERVGGLV